LKAESEGSVEGPGQELGSMHQEARTCPVCGTKFFATADVEFCPVCILREAAEGESVATGEQGPEFGLADGAPDMVAAMQVPLRRPERHYQVRADKPRQRRLHHRQSEETLHVARITRPQR